MFFLFIAAILLGSSEAQAEKAFEATAYVNSCAGCLGITYWKGLKADPWGPVKIMAVDPTVLQLGKCYKLRFQDGHHSTYLAADIGGDIKGHRLDLLLKSETSAKTFGRQKVHVVGETACPVNPHSLPRG